MGVNLIAVGLVSSYILYDLWKSYAGNLFLIIKTWAVLVGIFVTLTCIFLARLKKNTL